MAKALQCHALLLCALLVILGRAEQQEEVPQSAALPELGELMGFSKGDSSIDSPKGSRYSARMAASLQAKSLQKGRKEPW